AERRVGGWSLPGSGGLEMRFGRLFSASALELAVRRSGRRMPPAENFAASSGPRREWPANGSKDGADHRKMGRTLRLCPASGSATALFRSGQSAALAAGLCQEVEGWKCASEGCFRRRRSSGLFGGRDGGCRRLRTLPRAPVHAVNDPPVGQEAAPTIEKRATARGRRPINGT